MKRLFTIAWCIVCSLSLTSCQSEAEPTKQVTTTQTDQDTTRGVSRADGNIIYMDRVATRSDEASAKFKELTRSGNVFVDYYADWCPPCKAMGGVIDQIASEFPNVTFVKVNIETFQNLASGVRSIPVVRLYKNGSQIYNQAGAIKSASQMRSFLKQHFG